MTENTTKETANEGNNLQPNPQMAVTLPCHPDDFSDFVSNLLGKPQTIEKFFSKGTFSVNHQDIINTFHLVNQRIEQQNQSTLVQFIVKVFYDDESSVTLNSLDDFLHYTEVRPIKSEGVYLSWIYLIKFQQKKTPEKQQVDLMFRTDNDGGEVIHEDGIVIRRGRKWYGPGHIFFRISHTERTWGVDIESLLTGHIKTLLKPQNKQSNFITKHSGKIGFFIASLFLLSAIICVFIAIKRFTDSYLEQLKQISDKVLSSSGLLTSKVDFLINIIATGAWPKFTFYIFSFLFISLVVSVILGIWVEDKADNRPVSYVVLSKAAENFQENSLRKRRRDWVMFGISIITSIISSLVANIIFVKYFGSL